MFDFRRPHNSKYTKAWPQPTQKTLVDVVRRSRTWLPPAEAAARELCGASGCSACVRPRLGHRSRCALAARRTWPSELLHASRPTRLTAPPVSVRYLAVAHRLVFLPTPHSIASPRQPFSSFLFRRFSLFPLSTLPTIRPTGGSYCAGHIKGRRVAGIIVKSPSLLDAADPDAEAARSFDVDGSAGTQILLTIPCRMTSCRKSCSDSCARRPSRAPCISTGTCAASSPPRNSASSPASTTRPRFS